MKLHPIAILAIAPLLLCSVQAEKDKVQLSALAAKPLMAADKKQITHVKVGLTGFAMESDKRRVPVNLTIVLDRSGSMSGEKIAHARDAAAMAVRALAPTDVVSIVTFEQSVEVLVPATKASDKEAICKKIAGITPAGGTALFGGVSKGAEEMRKFLNKQSVNRILLLSDGIANIGASSPSELAELGASLIKEGISVTTIGLGSGYNEDLMTRLAQKSDGRHAFVEKPQQLVKIFEEEIGSVNSVVAQKVKIDILCDPGVRPVRVLGREAVIAGQKVSLDLNQIYSLEEKYLLLEVEVAETTVGVTRDLARVEVSYDNLLSHAQDKLTKTLSVKFSDNAEDVEKAVNKDVLVAAVTQIAAETNNQAVELRDQGKVAEAKSLLLKNAAYCSDVHKKTGSKELQTLSDQNAEDAKYIENNWGVNRKVMKDTNYQYQSVQSTKEIDGVKNRRDNIKR